MLCLENSCDLRMAKLRNIFTFLGFTCSASEAQVKLIFPFKNMFINYQFLGVIMNFSCLGFVLLFNCTHINSIKVRFAENTVFLVLYVMNAHGFFGNFYGPIAANDGWSSCHAFFVVAQPLLFLISFNLLLIRILLYSKKYQEWLNDESKRFNYSTNI